MGIFDMLKKEAEDTTQSDQSRPGDQFGSGQSGQRMQTAQNVIGQQGGYHPDQDQDQDGNRNQDR
jgi:hypothetical protein